MRRTGVFRKARVLAAAALTAVALVFVAWSHFGQARLTDEQRRSLIVALDAAEAVGRRSRIDWAAATDAVARHFQGRPAQASSTAIVRDTDEAVADGLLRSEFTLSGMPAQRLDPDLTWREDPLDDRSWRWALHVMEYLQPLVNRYAATGDPRYLQRAEDLVLDWITDNIIEADEDDPVAMAWQDHTTALRIRHWLRFWSAWAGSPLADRDEVLVVLYAVQRHAEMLASPDFYTEAHNHGVDQDRALMEIAVAFPEFSDSRAWVRLAVNRLRGQIESTVSPEGVHLEHSPAYHLYQMKRLDGIRRFASHNGIEVMPDEEMTGLLSRMADFLAYVTKPDGRLAPIGDTDWYHEINPGDPVVAEYATRSNLLRFVLSGGNEGTPGEPFKVYPPEGYAFFRDDWLPDAGFENAVYVLFTAAANPRRGHKHQDDLSFVLSAHGYDMLVDPGRHSYNYGDPGRQYVVRPEAHNTVAVDRSHSWDYSAEIVAHGAGDGFAWVSGRHRDFDGIEHLRTLVHLRPSTLLVVDHLRPTVAELEAQSNRFFQVFHLADDAVVERSGDGAVQAHFSSVSSPPATLSIVQLDRKPAVRLEIVRGQTKPMQGWIAKEPRQLTPAPAVVSEKRGPAVRFVTLLRIGRGDDVAGGRVPATMWETQSGIEARLPWDEREGVVAVARNGVVTVRPAVD